MNRLLRQQHIHTLPRIRRIPNTLPPAPPPLIPRALSLRPRRLPQYNLQIPLLRAQPSPHEPDRVIAHARQERVLGLVRRDRLHDDPQVLVNVGDAAEGGGVLRAVDEGGEARAERVVDGDAHVVDGWGRGGGGGVEGFVDADGVGEGERGEGLEVAGDVVVEEGDVAGVFVDDL